MNSHSTASDFTRTAIPERFHRYGGNTLTPYEIAPDAIAGLREALDTHPSKDRIFEHMSDDPDETRCTFCDFDNHDCHASPEDGCDCVKL